MSFFRHREDISLDTSCRRSHNGASKLQEPYAQAPGKQTDFQKRIRCMEKDTESKEKTKVYYFKCEGCHSDIFWSDIKPSVERASRVFKWVRAGCPNDGCSRYLILSSPDEVLDRQEAEKIYEDKKTKGKKKVYWI
jgi:hypothetical protein